MDPHVKESINRYQAKLLAIDKQLDGLLNEKEQLFRLYSGSKDDYKANILKKKAV